MADFKSNDAGGCPAAAYFLLLVQEKVSKDDEQEVQVLRSTGMCESSEDPEAASEPPSAFHQALPEPSPMVLVALPSARQSPAFVNFKYALNSLAGKSPASLDRRAY